MFERGQGAEQAPRDMDGHRLGIAIAQHRIGIGGDTDLRQGIVEMGQPSVQPP